MAVYDLSVITDTQLVGLAAGDIINCPYTGTYKKISLPAGMYKFECWGAEGGYNIETSTDGGQGGFSYGALALTQKQDLYLYVGGQGQSDTEQPHPNSGSSGTYAPGGFNGGGDGVGYKDGGTNHGGAGGGGATDIRIGTNDVYSRVIVAGGGGGASDDSPGGYGGGEQGGQGRHTTGGSSGPCGEGGTQTTAGYKAGFGFGGNRPPQQAEGGGGGGGWYGGGAGNEHNDDCSGGGGSGFVYTSATAQYCPTGFLLTSDFYLSQAGTIAGNQGFAAPDGTTETGHSGNGYIRITIIEGAYYNQKRRIKHKANRSTDWDPYYILLDRELGFETDTKKFKLGDGTKAWKDLPYYEKEEDRKIYAMDSNDAIDFTITDDKIKELYNGMEIMVIPEVDSATETPTLKINNGMAYPIRVLNLQANDYNLPLYVGWLIQGCPFKLRYCDEEWWAMDFKGPININDDSSGTLQISRGGTGATTIANARTNLGFTNSGTTLPVTLGGTGATSAANARTNLGLDSAWVKTQVQSVDGSGSGIDADTVDGIEGSGLARSNVTSSGYSSNLPSTSYTGGVWYYYGSAIEGSSYRYSIFYMYYSSSYYAYLAVNMSTGKLFTKTNGHTTWTECRPTISVLTADPSSPINGEMWLRSDL